MNNLRKSLLPVFTFAKIDIRRLFRDKVAIFFTFAFPLIFLIIFGGLFGNSSDVSFKVGVINESNTQYSKDFVESIKNNDVFKIDEKSTTLDKAKEQMSRSEVDATIILPSNFGQEKDGNPSGQVNILYDQNSQQAGETLSSVMQGILKQENEKIAPSVTPFTVKAESTATESQSRFDYTFAGLLGFAILSLGVFGPTSVFPRLKQRGVLRRYRTTTLKVWQYFLGNVLSSAMVGILSVSTMFIVAVTAFDLKMNGDYLSLAVVVILGTVVLFGIGLAVGGWAKNENQAAPLAQIFAFPMMFLSGTFFPRFLMPEWLQSVSALLPLTPVIDGARLVITEGRTLFEIGPQIGLLLIWAVIIYAIAFRVFRWE